MENLRLLMQSAYQRVVPRKCARPDRVRDSRLTSEGFRQGFRNRQENVAMKNITKRSRRDLLLQGGSALAGLALLELRLAAQAREETEGETPVPFLDRPPPGRQESNLLDWEALDSFMTPNEKFFRVSHYNRPIIDEADHLLQLEGLVDQPRSFTLAQLKQLPRQEVVFTMECSGNHGFPSFQGGIGTARWAGTPLAPILIEAGVQKRGIEVIFFGSDQGKEVVRDIEMTQHFARSMSLQDALNPNLLLCYEMNGKALPHLHGFPLRLIAPGWFGIANVKWMQRIEVRETRFMGRFMAKDYVSIREEPRKGRASLWTLMSVGRSLLKSMPARVTRKESRYRIYGAAWGTPVERVEVRINDGHWMDATIDAGRKYEFAWKLWHADWHNPRPGEHTITSRAIDRDGNIQPAIDDPRISGKHTYWESNGQITRKIRIG